MKKTLKRITGLVVTAMVGAQTTVWLFAIGMLPADTSSTTQAGLGMGWRQTRFGWQDSSHWFADPFAAQPMFEVIHPLVWATLVLISVIATTIWASEEWDLARLWERNGERKSP